MKIRFLHAVAFIALASGFAGAQAPAAPPAPAFAASNLSERGVRSLAANCSACHGTEGKAAPGATVPGLAGRPSGDIQGAMIQFKEGKRPATLMHQIAKGYSDAEIAALADYFSKRAR